MWWVPLASAAINAAGQAAGGSGPAAPSTASSGGYLNLDHSGWTVATGGSTAKGGGGSNSPADPNQFLWLAGAVLVGLLIWKKA